MIKFKNLFSFSQKEIKFLFQNASLAAQINGLKLLKADFYEKDQNFGKLLVITNRKTGKAHERNLIKRQLKSIFFEEKLFNTENNFIIIVYKAAIKLKFEQLKDFLIKNIKNYEN